MNESQSYIPGMCNINKAEVAYRKKAMWLGIGVSAVLLIVLVALSAPVLTRLILFVPTYVATIGYLQVKNKFCVAYGSSGKQNASEGSDSASTIEDEAALAADKKKTRTMHLQALGTTVVIVALTLLIPNIQF
jgi:hypothetical protein